MAKATAKDILTLIEEDHRKVEQLFEEISNTKAAKKVQECFNQIYKELTLHAKVEEMVFYPAMREYEETSQYIEEAEEEHNAVKILLEEMKVLKPNDAEFQTKLGYLQENTEHHVEEEESEIFSAVRECMKPEQLQELAQEFQETKTKLEPEVELAMSK